MHNLIVKNMKEGKKIKFLRYFANASFSIPEFM